MESWRIFCKKNAQHAQLIFTMERVAGIEPASPAWKAGVMSHYTTRATSVRTSRLYG